MTRLISGPHLDLFFLILCYTENTFRQAYNTPWRKIYVLMIERILFLLCDLEAITNSHYTLFTSEDLVNGPYAMKRGKGESSRASLCLKGYKDPFPRHSSRA